MKSLALNNWALIFFLFLHENICCGFSLKAPQLGTSNEYHKYVFVEKQEKKKIFMWIPLLSGAMQGVLISILHCTYHRKDFVWTNSVLCFFSTFKQHKCSAMWHHLHSSHGLTAFVGKYFLSLGVIWYSKSTPTRNNLYHVLTSMFHHHGFFRM